MKLSFIITLYNRINLSYTLDNKLYTLNLLGNNLNSIRQLVKKDDKWEFIIVDFSSTDANVNEFLKNNLNHPNFSYKLITLNEKFNKGKAINIAINHVSYDIVFCLDADMMIHTYKLFNDIHKHVFNNKKAFFPICYGYNDISHTIGVKREKGTGNVIFLKSDFSKYIEKEMWGREDDVIYYYFMSKKMAVREYYEKGFVHQWHPITEWHPDYNRITT